jgi:hypothetical protein
MSVFDRPGLTWQIRQFDRNPGRGETLLTAVADPSADALAAEAASQVRTDAVGSTLPNPRPEVYANRDYYRNMLDSESIFKRPDLEDNPNPGQVGEQISEPWT